MLICTLSLYYVGYHDFTLNSRFYCLIVEPGIQNEEASIRTQQISHLFDQWHMSNKEDMVLTV